jgi:hypothetical protein
MPAAKSMAEPRDRIAELGLLVVVAELDPAVLREAEDNGGHGDEDGRRRACSTSRGRSTIQDWTESRGRGGGALGQDATAKSDDGDDDGSGRARTLRGATMPLPMRTPWRCSFFVMASSESDSPMWSFSGRCSSTGSGSPNSSCSSGPGPSPAPDSARVSGSLMIPPDQLSFTEHTLPYSTGRFKTASRVATSSS